MRCVTVCVGGSSPLFQVHRGEREGGGGGKRGEGGGGARGGREGEGKEEGGGHGLHD
jgi:hypothetical protein